MKPEEINDIIDKQKNFFLTGRTLDISFRIDMLNKLKLAIKANEKEILNALKIDLGKSETEGYMCEVGLVISEINYILKHIKKWCRDKKVPTPLTNYKASSIIKPCPYGNVLIMSPWNYPFFLSMDPLIDAVAAGNTVVLKPSAYSKYTSRILRKVAMDTFDSEYITVIEGGREENSFLLSAKFDYIFFTGSQAVGKEVLRKAAEYLTPVTLELGGKSPCIVDETADINLSARRIVFGKFLNCGQTCVAPDYIYCHKSKIDELVNALINEIKIQYGDSPLNNMDYGKIINERHFNRLLDLIEKDKLRYGGSFNREMLKIEPTIMSGVTLEDKVMQEEIFGPILPILLYDSIEETVSTINNLAHPLALYIFSNNKKAIKYVTSHCIYGGGCVNDTVVHLTTPYLPFGGVGESGMGSYHGLSGFNTFSHMKSIMDKKVNFDLEMRYQPYKKSNKDLIHKMLS